MAMAKRVFLFILTNLLVITTITIVYQIIISVFFGGVAPVGLGGLMVFSAIWGMGGAFISLLMSKMMAKWMMGVKIIDPDTRDPRLHDYVQLVHELARKAKLPKMPEVGIYESPELNAFATGPSKSNALVAVSTGLLSRMKRDEIEGVLGHEIAHVANGDMVTMTLIQGVVNAFVLFLARVLASVVASAASRDGERSSAGLEIALIFAFQIIFGILGSLIVNYFSRMREYRADHGGARLASREKMISALQALIGGPVYDTPDSEQNFATLKISHQRLGVKLFSTHPPLEERIRRLQMARI